MHGVQDIRELSGRIYRLLRCVKSWSDRNFGSTLRAHGRTFSVLDRYVDHVYEVYGRRTSTEGKTESDRAAQSFA